jgi:hypothetical protein
MGSPGNADSADDSYRTTTGGGRFNMPSNLAPLFEFRRASNTFGEVRSQRLDVPARDASGHTGIGRNEELCQPIVLPNV